MFAICSAGGRSLRGGILRMRCKSSNPKLQTANKMKRNRWPLGLLPELISSGPRRPALINTKLECQLDYVES